MRYGFMALCLAWCSGTVFSEIAYGVSQMFALGSGMQTTSMPGPRGDAFLTITPNPFNASAVIRASLPGTLKLGIFDASGRLIRSYTAGSGAVVWDGKDAGGESVISGVYFVKATSGLRSITGRVVLIR